MGLFDKKPDLRELAKNIAKANGHSDPDGWADAVAQGKRYGAEEEPEEKPAE